MLQPDVSPGARDSAVCLALSATDADAKLHALRAIKNEIIGNKSRKRRFIELGAVPLVAEILSVGASQPGLDANLSVQARPALARQHSFILGPYVCFSFPPAVARRNVVGRCGVFLAANSQECTRLCA